MARLMTAVATALGGTRGAQTALVLLGGAGAFGCTKGVTPTVEAKKVVLAQTNNEPRMLGLRRDYLCIHVCATKSSSNVLAK